MFTLISPFASLTSFVFEDVSDASWMAYQPVATFISIAIVVAFLLAFLLYYYGLKSTAFSRLGWWLLPGIVAALAVGFYAYHEVYDLGITQNRITINLQPENLYDVLVGKARNVGIVAFGCCLSLYILLSFFRPLRHYHRDIPFTFRNRR
ncbi:hypothetical protein WDZ92_01185 [Nostoc sp. NIES-2111]